MLSIESVHFICAEVRVRVMVRVRVSRVYPNGRISSHVCDSCGSCGGYFLEGGNDKTLVVSAAASFFLEVGVRFREMLFFISCVKIEVVVYDAGQVCLIG
ncbi:unnamed protein product [Choristocarpus tenellus]